MVQKFSGVKFLCRLDNTTHLKSLDFFLHTCREFSVNFIYKEMKNDQIQSTTLASPLFGGQKHPAENYQQQLQLCCQRGGSSKEVHRALKSGKSARNRAV